VTDDHDPDDWSWYEDETMRALDEMLDPMPSDWETDIVANFHEGWDNLTAGDRHWVVSRRDVHGWRHSLQHRAARLERLRDMDAPQIILDRESALVAIARAGFWWQAYLHYEAIEH